MVDRNGAWYVFVPKLMNVNCHHPQPRWAPHPCLPVLKVLPTAFDTPHTHLIHLSLGLLQSPVTGEVWRGCRGASLPSWGGGGGGGSGSRPEGQKPIKTQGLEPPTR